MILWQLFVSFLRIGFLAFGGAYSFLPLIQKDAVEQYHWLTKPEFLEILGIVKVFPGAISIKYATYIGYKMAGIPGAVVANVGNLLAPVILILSATFLYTKYKDLPPIKHAFEAIQVVVFALIIAVAFEAVSLNQIANLRNVLLIIAAFGLYLYAKIHPAFIIIGAGVLGVLIN
ncbi:MAG: chromate transporter [Candidatus Omnitrophica bacterium]|nr:chromate transporter [Candidatus Omnitrophota bacterium]